MLKTIIISTIFTFKEQVFWGIQRIIFLKWYGCTMSKRTICLKNYWQSQKDLIPSSFSPFDRLLWIQNTCYSLTLKNICFSLTVAIMAILSNVLGVAYVQVNMEFRGLAWCGISWSSKCHNTTFLVCHVDLSTVPYFWLASYLLHLKLDRGAHFLNNLPHVVIVRQWSGKLASLV